MGLCKEVVGVHGGRQHGGQRPGRGVRLHGRSQNHHVRLNMELAVFQQVRGLHQELAPLGDHLPHLALDVVDAILLHRPAVELVESLAWRPDVDVKHIHFGVRVLFPAEHGVLGGVHAADFGAIGLAPAVSVTPGTHALDEYQGMGMLSVGGAQEGPACGTGGIHQPLQLQGGDHIGALAIGVLPVRFQ